MKRLLAFCLCLGSAMACSAAEPDAFPFYRNVEWEASNEEEILDLTLDAEAYAETADDFQDLRVFDDQNTEVPYHEEKVVTTRNQIVRRASVE